MASEAIRFHSAVSIATADAITVSGKPSSSAGLTPRVALTQAVWGGPCEGMFRDLAITAPAELAELIRLRAIRDSRLTYAAEVLGRDVGDNDLVVQALLPLLNHPSHLVREGAVLGLSYHLTDVVREFLRLTAESDPSRGVRETAREALA